MAEELVVDFFKDSHGTWFFKSIQQVCSRNSKLNASFAKKRSLSLSEKIVLNGGKTISLKPVLQNNFKQRILKSKSFYDINKVKIRENNSLEYRVAKQVESIQNDSPATIQTTLPRKSELIENYRRGRGIDSTQNISSFSCLSQHPVKPRFIKKLLHRSDK